MEDLDSNEKRWVLVGIALNKVLAPALRNYVKNELDRLWQDLNRMHRIESQQYPNHMQIYLCTFFNYEAINDNRVHGLRQQKKFNFNVKNSVDLSKLFLHTNMAMYSAFDENCDLSALLRIIMNSGICSIIGQYHAFRVRDEVLNPWSRSNFSYWHQTKFSESLAIIKKLVHSIGLSEEYALRSQLQKLENNGKNAVGGQPDESDLFFNMYSELLQSQLPRAIYKMDDQSRALYEEALQSGSEVKPQLPSAIYKMDDQSRALYEEALQSGSEVKREIRVIIVGKKGAGKTTLTRRLLSKSLDDVKSTNGVNIHFVTLEDQKRLTKRWHETSPTTANSRLLVGALQTEKRIQEKLEEEKIEQKDVENTFKISVEDNTTEEALSSGDTVTAEAQESTIKRKDDRDTELVGIIKAPVTNENEIRISIWDFGGDEEFYYTHPVFLSEDAVFLVITSLVDFDNCSHGQFNFWFETLHCLRNETEGTKPRCVVIGTHKDGCETEKAAKEKMAEKLKTLNSALKKHIYGEAHVISNTLYDEDDLKKVKAAILNAAKEGKNWETTHPLKFVLLDKALEKWKQGVQEKPVVTHAYIQQINDNLTEPLSVDEMKLYLRFNHDAGHLIFFKDIPQYIILDPKWLSDVFRSIVAADEFQLQLPQLDDWNDLRITGKITEKLLRAVFRQIEIDEKHYEYLRKVMEKFHIIIKLPYKVGDSVKHSYFAPCMIRDNKLPNLATIYNEVMTKSTCLCLAFDFLPPFVFNHMMIMCCEKYVYTEYLPSFYTDAAIFTISSNGCSKLVLVKYQNIVQLQVLVLGAGDHLQSRGDIKTFFEGITKEIIHTFSLQIKYEVRQKCQDTAFDCCDGLRALVCQEPEYFCKEHNSQHSFRNDWIDIKQNTVHNGSTLSQKQQNFTRLSLLVTEVVVDALHDLLPSPKTKTRNQSDMTSLYQEHRKLNQHKPSSYRWGGVQTVNDIPSTAISVGDDIERCRVIRNRLNHSSHYEMEDSEFEDLYKMIHEILTRLHNFIGLLAKPTYMEKAEEIKRKTYQLPEMKKVEEQLEKEPQVIKYYYTENNEVHHHYNYWCNLL